MHSKWNKLVPNKFPKIPIVVKGSQRWPTPPRMLSSTSKVLQSFKIPPKTPKTFKLSPIKYPPQGPPKLMSSLQSKMGL